MKKITDKQRLDFLVKHRLDAPCLVNDDNDHWCVALCESISIAGEGVKITDFEKEFDATIKFIISKDQWKNSPREAIDAYMEKCELEHFDDGRTV